MTSVFFIVGSSASGKSTTDRNLRLRHAGCFEQGRLQVVDNVVFVGRILFTSGKKVLRFTGGDNTPFDYLLDVVDTFPDSRIVFEKMHITYNTVKSLVSRGCKVVFMHLQVTRSIAQERLVKLKHPWAERDDFHAYRPLKTEYREKRDSFLKEQGVPIVYIDGTMEERLQQIELVLGITPRYPYHLLDFTRPVTEIYERFLAGGIE